MFRRRAGLTCIAAVAAAQITSCGQAGAEDKLLTEAVNFTGTLTYLGTKVPGFMLVGVRNGETAFAGFGTVTDKGGKTPDADTLFHIGSDRPLRHRSMPPTSAVAGSHDDRPRLQPLPEGGAS